MDLYNKNLQNDYKENKLLFIRG